MEEDTKQKIIEKYNERLKLYGYDPRSVGWFKGRQTLRFKVLTEIGNLNNCSVLDVGCGFGDLYGYLIKKGLSIKYTGIDINLNLIKLAKEVYPEAHFEVIDVAEYEKSDSFDWLFACGFFEFKIPEENYVQKMLKKMYTICTKGVAVDFMSSYVDFTTEDAYHADPAEIFRFCKTLSKRVTLRHDYMPFEFCIYIYKNDRITDNNVFEELKY
jgi:trans-aconitate methyltransferase